MNPLYHLIEDHRQLMRFADEGEIDPQTLRDTLEGLTGEIEQKCQSVAMFIRNLEADAAAIETAARAQLTRAAALQGRANAIRNYLLVNMQATDITKISCPYFTISRRQNPAACEIIDASLVPDEFKTWPEPPPPAIDKRKILEAFAAGTPVPGVAVTRGERVEIRT